MKIKKVLCVMLSALICAGCFACKKTPVPEPPVPPEVEYKTLTFEYNNELVFHSHTAVTDADLVQGLVIKDAIGISYTAAVVDKTSLKLGVKTATGYPYEITVGAKDASGNFVKKSETENWEVTRKIHVKSVEFDFLEIEGNEILTADAGTVLTQKDIAGNMKIKDGTTGELYSPVVLEPENIDTFTPESTVFADIILEDSMGKVLMENASDRYVFQRQINVGGLYFIEAAQNNGDKGPWGTRESLLGLSAEQAMRLTGITDEGREAMKLPVRESNVVELDSTNNNRTYPIYNSDPLGARLFINKSTLASRTVNVLGGSGVAVIIGFDGKIEYVYDGLGSREVNSTAAKSELITAPTVTLKSYGANFSIPKESMALFLSNENSLTGAKHNSVTSGCQFVLKNIASEYRNYVRVFKGGSGIFDYESSAEKITAYPEALQDIRMYGYSSNVLVDVAYEDLIPDTESIKASVISGVRLLVNYNGGNGKAGWNCWAPVDITTADVAVPDGFDIAALKNYNFNININKTVVGQVINQTVTRTVTVFNSKPDGKAFDFYIGGQFVRYTPSAADNSNNSLVINGSRTDLRTANTGSYRIGLYTYDYFWEGEDEDRVSNLYSETNTEGNYFKEGPYNASAPWQNLGENGVALLFDTDGNLRAVFSPVGAVGISERVTNEETGEVSFVQRRGGNSAIITDKDFGVQNLIKPGEIVIVAPNGSTLRNFWDTSNAGYNGVFDFFRNIPQRDDIRIVMWNLTIPGSGYNGQIEWKNPPVVPGP